MKNLSLFLLSLLSLNLYAKNPEPAQLRYTEEFILEQVLELKNWERRPEIPIPTYHYASKTPVEVFQDAIEEQWGMRPDFITNAFAVKHNMIFISDDAAYYERTGRCMDDSVAHELTHYVQAKYKNWDLNDDSLEWDAIDIQTRFREKFCK